ncbi:uncharacterized protein M6B38_163715 [Iris pallida]|uniref:Uncharacterized protein n=1 Tax=Iris pallida TaxID=29817 RepID=A0AAX6EY28_IRIPA|nr:uncharacterized protein M6B38_163715 [Iris pallida]
MAMASIFLQSPPPLLSLKPKLFLSYSLPKPTTRIPLLYPSSSPPHPRPFNLSQTQHQTPSAPLSPQLPPRSLPLPPVPRPQPHLRLQVVPPPLPIPRPRQIRSLPPPQPLLLDLLLPRLALLPILPRRHPRNPRRPLLRQALPERSQPLRAALRRDLHHRVAHPRPRRPLQRLPPGLAPRPLLRLPLLLLLRVLRPLPPLRRPPPPPPRPQVGHIPPRPLPLRLLRPRPRRPLPRRPRGPRAPPHPRRLGQPAHLPPRLADHLHQVPLGALPAQVLGEGGRPDRRGPVRALPVGAAPGLRLHRDALRRALHRAEGAAEPGLSCCGVRVVLWAEGGAGGSDDGGGVRGQVQGVCGQGQVQIDPSIVLMSCVPCCGVLVKLGRGWSV